MITKREKLKQSVDTLNQDDIYSLILFALYKLRELPEYAPLSELIYVLNRDSLVKFLTVFGGTTITVPTLSEFNYLINALLLYEYVNLEGMTFAKASKILGKNEVEMQDIKVIYTKVCEILNTYEFSRKEIT